MTENNQQEWKQFLVWVQLQFVSGNLILPHKREKQGKVTNFSKGSWLVNSPCSILGLFGMKLMVSILHRTGVTSSSYCLSLLLSWIKFEIKFICPWGPIQTMLSSWTQNSSSHVVSKSISISTLLLFLFGKSYHQIIVVALSWFKTPSHIFFRHTPMHKYKWSNDIRTLV